MRPGIYFLNVLKTLSLLYPKVNFMISQRRPLFEDTWYKCYNREKGFQQAYKYVLTCTNVFSMLYSENFFITSQAL